MGSANSAGHVFDLRRMEDIFACLEIISVARGALYSVNPELAGRMEKVSNALGALAQLVMEEGADSLIGADKGGLVAGAETDKRIEELPPDVFSDMTVHVQKTPPASPERSAGGRKAAGAADENNGIVDILTGERIK